MTLLQALQRMINWQLKIIGSDIQLMQYPSQQSKYNPGVKVRWLGGKGKLKVIHNTMAFRSSFLWMANGIYCDTGRKRGMLRIFSEAVNGTSRLFVLAALC